MANKRKSVKEKMENNKMGTAISALIGSNEEADKEANKEVKKEADKEADKEVKKEVNKEVKKEADKEADKEVKKEVNKEVKIVIEKIKKENKPKKATFFIHPSTLKKIDKVSKQTGLGKSALVQKLLEEALEMIDIK